MNTITTILEAHVVGSDGDTVNKLLGAAAVVVDRHGVLYSGAAGKINLSSEARPFTVDSFGWIASLSKLVTTTLAMQLVEEGVLALDEDLRPLVPELNALRILRGFDDDGKPKVEKNAAAVTLRHLLTHTCGLTCEPFDTRGGFLNRYNQHIGRTQTASDCTKSGLLSGTTLTFAPGESWSYSQGIDWTGYLIERVTGKSLEECLRERVFEPLGMKSTAFFPDVPVGARGKEIALPCRQEDGSLVPLELPLLANQEYKMGGIRLCSTARDYGALLKALHAGDLLKESALDEMFWP